MRVLAERSLAQRMLVAPADVRRALPVVPWAWWSADDVSVDPVWYWPDRANRRVLVRNGTGANREPSFSRLAVNNRPAVTFNGSTNALGVAVLETVAQPYTILAVVRLSGGSGNRHFVGAGGSAVGFGIEDGVFMGYAGNLIATSINADTDWHVYMAVVDGSSSRIRVDGATTTGNLGGRDLVNPRVGAFSAGQNPWPGDIAELMIVPSAVSAGEEAELFDYLTTRYGL